jgi:iron complex outermembrane receptor protein
MYGMNIDASTFLDDETYIIDEKKNENTKITVTGSHIKQAEQITSSPLSIITQEDIQRSGAASLWSLLQVNVLNNGASQNNQLTNGLSLGSSSFNLRGLRSDRTLILIDGKRLPHYPFGNNGTTAFVDLNSIALSEIESIEILKDGASAVYGSDAISGVINIKTKQTIKQPKLQLTTTQSKSNYSKNTIALMNGVNTDTIDTAFIIEYQETKALLGKDTLYASQLKINELSEYSFPGTYFLIDENNQLNGVAPDGCQRIVPSEDLNDFSGDACAFDWAGERQLIPENERLSLSLKMTQYLGIHTLYSGLSYSQITTHSDIASRMSTIDLLINADHPFTPKKQPMYLSRGLSELGLREIETHARNVKLTLGLNGVLNEYDYDITFQRAESMINEAFNHGWMSRSQEKSLHKAFKNKKINPFIALTENLIDEFTTELLRIGRSTQNSFSMSLSGELMSFEEDAIYFATGIDFREESIEDWSDDLILSGEILGLSSSSALGDRKITSLFSEFIVPLRHDLELNIAARYDEYNDFGSSVNPKVSIRYTPISNLTLRSSWGTGFRAPNLFELYTDEIDGTLGDIDFVKRGNQGLTEEESESFNIGMAWNFQKELFLSFDYWSITIDNMITSLGVNTIIQSSNDGSLVYEEYITRDEFDEIESIHDPLLNLAQQKATGIDLNIHYEITQTFNWKLQIAYLVKLEQKNQIINEIISLDGAPVYPKLKLNTQLIWKGDYFSTDLNVYYIGKHNVGDANQSSEVQQVVRDNGSVKAFINLDYAIYYQDEDYRLTLRVNNLLDVEPETSTFYSKWPYFAQTLYSPLGRTLTLQFDYLF